MRRRVLMTVGIGCLAAMLMGVTAEAKGGISQRSNRDRFGFARNGLPLTSIATPGEYLNSAEQSVRQQRMALGSAAFSSAVSSPGFSVDRSYMDDFIRPDHKGRTVDWRTTPDIHFAYSDAPTSTANQRIGYNVYTPLSGGSWPQGAEVGCEVGPTDQQGQWATMDVDGNGFVILAGVDNSGVDFDNHTYYQSSPFSCFWSGGTLILPSQYGTGDFFSDTTSLLRPVVEHQVWTGDTITHLLAGESQTLSSGGIVSGVMMYFRKVGNFTNGTWEGPLVVDTTAFAFTGSMSASRVSPKVAYSYSGTGVLGVANGAINGGFDNEVYLRVSDSVGVSGTWSAAINLTQGGMRTAPSHTPFLETHTLYDSEGMLHVVYNGFPIPADVYDSTSFFWIDFSGSILHWSDRTNLWSRVHNAEWGLAQNTQVCGFGSPGVGYLGFENISECDGRMYCTFVQYLDFFGNSGLSQIDDCASGGFDARRHAANGEIYLSVSTGLDGLLWDASRNITNTYTPDCDSLTGGGVCMNDTRLTVSRYGMDEAAMTADFGALSWPATALVDVSPEQNYAGDHYLHVLYMEDHFPSPAWRNNAWGLLTENPLNWMRLACVDPITAPQIAYAPQSTGYPQQVDHGMSEVITVTVTNDGNTALTVTQITSVESSGPVGWLGVSTPSFSVSAGSGNTATFEIIINVGGMINSPGTIVPLSGEVYLLSDAPSPRDSVSFIITDFIVGPVADLVRDTVSTGTISLTMSNNGNMGNGGQGGVNLDYTAPGSASPDCDSTATVYMFDGSLLIIQKIDSTTFHLSTNLFTNGFGPSYAFKPISDQTLPLSFVGPGSSDAFNTGTYVNWDSSIAVEQTFYAPSGGSPNDNFIIVKTSFFSNDGMTHDNLLLGDLIDWDTPSDNGAANTAGILTGTSKNIVYLRGVDTAAIPGCQLFSTRYSASAFMGMYNNTEFADDPCANTRSPWGVYASDNTGENPAAAGAPNNAVDSALVWNEGGSLTGQWALTPDTVDLRITQTYVWDYTLGATDTLTVYNALITIKNGTVADLDASVESAIDWYAANLRGGCDVRSCCVGSVGNIDGDGGVDIADLTFLIDHLFINFPILPCDEEGNVDADGGIDIADLTFLIDHLFINFPLLPNCP